MNYTVIPKSITKFNTGNNKSLDIYVWAYIKLCSNNKTNISNITEEKLSEKTGIPLRTIGRSIKRLKDAKYLEVHTRITDGCKKRNSYHFKIEYQNFALIDNGFFHKDYTPTIAGFMLLLRAICLNNTDKIFWPIIRIAEAIGIGRNTVSRLLNECQELGIIKEIQNGYEITDTCLSHKTINNEVKTPVYKVICDFCESKGVASPIWNKDAVSVISTKYSLDLPSDSEFSLIGQLEKRCRRLPKEVTLPYFVTALGMDTQYRKLMAEKSAKTEKEYQF